MDKLAVLKSFTGKEFTSSPSPFMRWLNPVGNLHGGVTAAIMDDIIGATMFSLNEEHFIVTINNSIDYFSTAKENDPIIAETKIIKRGKQFVNAECEIWNADKTRLIARGTSNLFKISN